MQPDFAFGQFSAKQGKIGYIDVYQQVIVTMTNYDL